VTLGRKEKEQKERNKEREKKGGVKVAMYRVHARSIDIHM